MAVPHKLHLEALLVRLEAAIERLEGLESKVDEDAVKAAEKYIERRSWELKKEAGLGVPEI